MDDSFNTALEWRTSGFVRLFELMQHRSKVETLDNCFCIFDEFLPDADHQPARVASKAKSLAMVGKTNQLAAGADSNYSSWPTDGWRDDANPKSRRFVQFAFLPKYFMMDLPRSTLTRDEAVRLIRTKPGFFYLRDNPGMTDSPTSSRQIRTYDPFCKAYLEHDERQAAIDMAFVFFLLWHFPIDSKLFLTAFSGNRTSVQFEKGFPVE